MWGGTRPAQAQSIMLAPTLMGRDPAMREDIYDDCKRLLGGYRKRLQTYASTFHGDNAGGLDSPEKFGEFAVQCREMGFKGYKIHGWFDGDKRAEAAIITACRKAVGAEMDASRMRCLDSSGGSTCSCVHGAGARVLQAAWMMENA